MNVVQLPIVADGAHFRFTTELDGATYGFEFRWNHRSEQWKLSVFDGDGVALVHGITLVVGFELFHRYRAYGTLPPGNLIVLDTEGQNAKVGFENLGRRFLLYYVS